MIAGDICMAISAIYPTFLSFFALRQLVEIVVQQLRGVKMCDVSLRFVSFTNLRMLLWLWHLHDTIIK